MGNILNKLTVAEPVPDGRTRDICIPDSVRAMIQQQKRNGTYSFVHGEGGSGGVPGSGGGSSSSAAHPVDYAYPQGAGGAGGAEGMDVEGGRRKTQKEKMWERGGPGVYAQPWEEHYKGMLAAEEWTTDIIPMIMDGKNIADFVDPDIEAKVAALEREEEALEAELEANGDGDDESDIDEDERALVKEIRKKKKVITLRHAREKNMNRPIVPRKYRVRRQTPGEFREGLAEATGGETERVRVPGAKRGRSLTRIGADVDEEEEAESKGMDVEGGVAGRTRSRSRSQSRTRSQSQARARESREAHASKGLKSNDGGLQIKEMTKQARAKRFRRNKMARAGEGDRHTTASKPKWLLAGKSSLGTSTRGR